jgi:radical SAM protein with 4Fe4S-binding SPASM domain
MSNSPFRHIGSVFFKNGPIQLTFFLTGKCNASCPFCFYLSENNSAGSSPELTLDEIEKISQSMGSLLWLAFSGGEIFLRKDIVEIAKIFYKNNKPSIMLFPTNGLLTELIKNNIIEVLQHCRESTVALKLSIEGTESVHDRIRGKGSFRKTMKTYKALRELSDRYPNFELGVNSVFCSVNQDGMDELIGFVNGLDAVKTHTVSLIRGNVRDIGLKMVDMKKYNKTIELLASNLRSRRSGIYGFRGARLKAAQDIVQRDLIYKTALSNKFQIPCYAGRLNIVLTESGDVYPCESFDMKFGNVRESGYDIGNILESRSAKKITRSIQDSGCFCTHECYLMTNILFNPRMYPRLIKEYIRL